MISFLRPFSTKIKTQFKLVSFLTGSPKQVIKFIIPQTWLFSGKITPSRRCRGAVMQVKSKAKAEAEDLKPVQLRI